METREYLDRAKVTLYKWLLELDTNQLTPNEIELGYLLAKDPAIQEILKKTKP